MSLRAVDLFCGAGGASCGMADVGVDIVAAVDQNTDALRTHEANLPGEHIEHDLSDVDTSVLPEGAQDTDIDWVHGSPPCKGFSTAQGSRDLDDDRNELVFSFIKWVEAIEPTVATMENVTGMTNISDEWMDAVFDAFAEAGYEARSRELNAANYGVPQTRKRVYIMAVRDDHPKPDDWFPQRTHDEDGTGDEYQPWLTAGEALDDIAGTEEEIKSMDVSNHVPINHQDSTREKLGEYGLGTTHNSTTECRLHPDRPAFTVSVSNATPHVHYQDNPVRRMTVRECARLQTFPDDFEFSGTRTAQYNQVGNAVPPRLQSHVAAKVRSILSLA